MKVIEIVPLGESRLLVEEDPPTEGVRLVVVPGWGEPAPVAVVPRRTLAEALERIVTALRRSS